MADFEQTLKRPPTAFRPATERRDPVAPKLAKPPKITAPAQLLALFHEGFLTMDEQEIERTLPGINDRYHTGFWSLPMQAHSPWHATNTILLAGTWRELIRLPGTPPVVAGREVPLVGVDPKSYRSAAYIVMKRALLIHDWYLKNYPNEIPSLAELETVLPTFVPEAAPTVTVQRRLVSWLLDPNGDERAQAHEDPYRRRSAAATLPQDFTLRWFNDPAYQALRAKFAAHLDGPKKQGLTLTWGRDTDTVDTLSDLLDWVVAHATGTVKGSSFFYVRQDVYDLRRWIEAFRRDGRNYEAPEGGLTLPIRVPTAKDLPFFHLLKHADALDSDRTDADINNEYEGQRFEPKTVAPRRSFTPPPAPKRKTF